MAQGPHHYAVGAALILLVDVLWTSSNYLSSTVLTHGYDKPFAVTYLSTATFIVYLIPIAALYYTQSSGQRNESPMPLWWERLGFRPPHMRPATYTHPHSHSALENSLPSEELALPRPKRPSSIDGRRPKSDLRLPMDPSESHPSILDFTIRGRSPQPSGERRPLRTPSRESLTSYMSDADCEDTHTSAHVISASELPPLSVTETFYLSMEFAVIWFAANWSFVAGLAYTSVASGTTLGSTSGFFTLLLGSLVGTDSFSPGKLASVLLRFVDATYLQTASVVWRSLLGVTKTLPTLPIHFGAIHWRSCPLCVRFFFSLTSRLCRLCDTAQGANRIGGPHLHASFPGLCRRL